jgi:ABC-2 type transport system permease protein
VSDPTRARDYNHKRYQIGTRQLSLFGGLPVAQLKAHITSYHAPSNSVMQELKPHEMTYPEGVLNQVRTIAELRWRMFLNGLRSKRGKMELASRILITIAFTVGGTGAFALATGFAWYFVSQNNAAYLAILLWPVFFFWQLFPMMSTAFTNNPDSAELLRFPLTYRSYFLIRLAYGFFDPASALGTVGLLGILLGISLARPWLFPWALLVLLTFALFNLVLMQTIFAWVERWLAQRRTREILGVLFILSMLSFQLVGPMMNRLGKTPHPGFRRAVRIAAQVQTVLPPGLAANAIAQTTQSRIVVGSASLFFLAALTIVIGSLLHLRLRAQFHGENLSEAAAPAAVAQTQALQVGWNLPGFSSSIAAVFEKEMRYLARSGPMLLTLVMPVFMLLIFRLGPMNSLRHSNSFSRTPDMAFPGAAAYAILTLTNLVFNSFGGDAGGIQFFYAAPVAFRHIVLAKNLTHACILAANTVLAWIAVSYLYGIPHLAASIATLAGLLFAAPLNFAAGNLLSIYAPKKRDFSAFGRQNVSQTTVLATFGVQIVIVGVGVAVFAIARLYKDLWIATLVFLVLAAISIPVYLLVLRRLDSIAIQRQETLVAELCRA